MKQYAKQAMLFIALFFVVSGIFFTANYTRMNQSQNSSGKVIYCNRVYPGNNSGYSSCYKTWIDKDEAVTLLYKDTFFSSLLPSILLFVVIRTLYIRRHS